MDNKNIIDSYYWNSQNNQSEELLVNIDQILKKNKCLKEDLSGVAAATGPGSYTGIRVGIATANALAYSLNIGICGYNVLELSAEYIFSEEHQTDKVIVLANAIYDKYYFGKFSKEKNELSAVYGNDLLNNILLDDKYFCVCIDGECDLKKCGKISLSDSDMQKFTVKYISRLLHEEKYSNKIIKPFYINQPNIT